jgi:hypothetical protein
MSEQFISQLYLYPVKSFKGVRVDRARLDDRGFVGDRRYMLVDHNGRFITQRQISELVLFHATVNAAGLQLAYQDKQIFVDRPDRESLVDVQVWSDAVQAVDCGDAAADWLSSALEQSVRLVYMPDSSERKIDPAYATNGQLVSFADGFPLLLIGQTSLEDLCTRLGRTVVMERFRPNIVVSGCEAFAEDGWKRLRIGSTEFDIVKPCSRCVIPSIDPASAKKDPEVVRVLASYRRGSDRKTYFGQNLIHRSSGTIHIGDAIEVLE